MDYLYHLLVYVAIFGMLSLSLNVASGYTKLVSLTHAAFYGVGAYTAAVCSTHFGWSLWSNLVVGLALGTALAYIVGIAALRTVDEVFVICTLGLGYVLWTVFNNATTISGGAIGISNIPTGFIGGYPLTEKWQWTLLCSVICGAMFYICRNISKSALGRIMIAISEDEIFCQSLGKDVHHAKLTAFVVGSALATVPGILYAHYTSFIDPTSFTINEAVYILSITIIGGMGNLRGGLAAATFMVLLPEALRFVGLPSTIGANIRQMVVGIAIITAIWIENARRSRQNQNLS